MKTNMTPKKWALAFTIFLASAIASLADDGSNRIWIVGLTNGSVVSGRVRFPVKFAVTNKEAVTGVAVYTTNGPLIGADAMSVADYRRWLSRYGTNGPLLADTNNDDQFLFWDASLSANGTYAVVASLGFDGTDEPVVSPPVTVTISNLFSFPNEISLSFGSRMWIYFQTIPGASVQIDVYGQDTNYLGSFQPTSDTNGIVSFLWDLTDGNGHRFKDTSFGGVFTLEKMPAVSHPASQPNLRMTSMPPYMRLEKFEKRASQDPTAIGIYQVACQWNGRQQ